MRCICQMLLFKCLGFFSLHVAGKSTAPKYKTVSGCPESAGMSSSRAIYYKIFLSMKFNEEELKGVKLLSRNSMRTMT